MYAKVENGTITALPYSYAQLRSDNPNTSLPPEEELQPADVAPFNALPVIEQPSPAHDAFTQKLVQTTNVQATQVVRGWSVVATTTEERAATRAALLARIDADVDAITSAVVGSRAVEYTEAETQARAYQQAGYSGPVPSMVGAWVAAKAIEGATWTSQQAADDILATAAAWRGAVDLIRSNRLNAKAYVRTATNQAGLDTAMAQWSGFVAAVRSQLGI
jgi:hypothetical protein